MPQSDQAPAPEPQRESRPAHSYGETVRAIREALQLRDEFAADLETAWAECSARLPNLDEAMRQRLRAAFESGYREVRNPGRVVLVVPLKPKPPEPDQRAASAP